MTMNYPGEWYTNTHLTDISKNLNVDPSTVCRIIQRFEETGSVSKATFPRGHEHPHQNLRPMDEFLILQLVLGKLGVYLDEIQKELLDHRYRCVSLDY